jgi:hypothetical protein
MSYLHYLDTYDEADAIEAFFDGDETAIEEFYSGGGEMEKAKVFYRKPGFVTAVQQLGCRRSVQTQHGSFVAYHGDWMVTDELGRRYPVAKEDFKKLYGERGIADEGAPEDHTCIHNLDPQGPVAGGGGITASEYEELVRRLHPSSSLNLEEKAIPFPGLEDHIDRLLKKYSGPYTQEILLLIRQTLQVARANWKEV